MNLRRRRTELSLFYRENKADIDAGRVPARYSRVARCVSTDSAAEMGSAEGTLGLLLADAGKRYIGIEPNPARHALAVSRVAEHDLKASHGLLFGDLRHHLGVLDGFDTFVGMRCIYYLREDVERVFDHICSSVKEVVLTGNAERESRFLAGDRGNLGEFERFATLDGMTDLLMRRGFRITQSEKGIAHQQDPLIVAHSPTYSP